MGYGKKSKLKNDQFVYQTQVCPTLGPTILNKLKWSTWWESMQVKIDALIVNQTCVLFSSTLNKNIVG